MKTTRQRILDYLAAHGSATAAELGAALQVTSADIRHHLAYLQSQELVVNAAEDLKKDRQPGRGRPARRFRLPTLLPDSGLVHLLAALLAESYDSLPPPEQEAYLRRIAARLAAPPLPAAGLSQRLVLAVQRLDQIGYQTRWEAHASGPRLILARRPFANLEGACPELARLEVYLIEQLLSSPASPVSAIRLPHTHGAATTYQVKALPHSSLTN